MTTDVTVACSTTDATDGMHSCQLSRNLRDSPGFLTCVPEGSRKSALAQIVPEKL